MSLCCPLVLTFGEESQKPSPPATDEVQCRAAEAIITQACALLVPTFTGQPLRVVTATLGGVD